MRIKKIKEKKKSKTENYRIEFLKKEIVSNKDFAEIATENLMSIVKKKLLLTSHWLKKTG